MREENAWEGCSNDCLMPLIISATLLCLFIRPMFQCNVRVEFKGTDLAKTGLCLLRQFAQRVYIQFPYVMYV
jgi:hypothetical protein